MTRLYNCLKREVFIETQVAASITMLNNADVAHLLLPRTEKMSLEKPLISHANASLLKVHKLQIKVSFCGRCGQDCLPVTGNNSAMLLDNSKTAGEFRNQAEPTNSLPQHG